MLQNDESSVLNKEITKEAFVPQVTKELAYSNKIKLENDNVKLFEYQTHAENVANGFKTTEFNPASFSTNPHFQTISAVYLRTYPHYSYWNPKFWFQNAIKSNEVLDGANYWDRRQRIDTPDGDFFDVDWKYSSGLIKGKVVIQHGLEANSNSSLCIELAESHVSRGFDVACINFRGCSGEPNRKDGAYHLGFTDDMKHFLSIISLGTDCPIYLVGFSLGANVILKLLGELGTAAKDKYNIKGASVNCAPFDTEIHYLELLKPGINKYIYTPNFLKTMKTKAKAQYELLGGNVKYDIEKVLSSKDIPEYENNFIAPIYGFDDYIDYYRKTSCGYFLSGIAVPTFIINSRDDPFFGDVSPPPLKPNPIQFLYTDRGGHCGYVFHSVSDEECDQLPVTSWMPNELARFVSYLHELD